VPPHPRRHDSSPASACRQPRKAPLLPCARDLAIAPTGGALPYPRTPLAAVAAACKPGDIDPTRPDPASRAGGTGRSVQPATPTPPAVACWQGWALNQRALSASSATSRTLGALLEPRAPRAPRQSSLPLQPERHVQPAPENAHRRATGTARCIARRSVAPGLPLSPTSLSAPTHRPIPTTAPLFARVRHGAGAADQRGPEQRFLPSSPTQAA
jgi:hypothetical protein